MELNDVSAIITGASRGLGLAFTRAILLGGGRVFMTDIDLAQLEKEGPTLQREFLGRVQWQKQDVTDVASFDAAFDGAARAFPAHPTNVLVNNAGIVASDDFYATTSNSTSWTKVIAINTTAVLRGTQVALRRLSSTSRSQAVVVNIASMAGLWPMAETPDYSASKAAVVAFTKAVGAISKKTNVRVTALCPGFADTRIGQTALANAPAVVNHIGGLLTPTAVADGLVQSLADANNSGDVLVVSNRGLKYHFRKQQVAKL
ncbi:Aste57867_9962 [Aphanomyces stellatus]|uniref:Aste57867_9962 protein n=1 Tax=Aphanomyces stellatus TaxID=120398 RepID=A0A485KPG2_9STRA|nr:hypothetical protein As57867_009923 [Aphanomyces stellatus]VFT86840.1 Aste57867_9962 [Aphanomyces stellatus]